MTRGRRGTILVTSLWILAILSILAAGIGFRVSVEARLAKYNMDGLKALYLARAGLVKSLYRLSKSRSACDTIYECGTTFSAEERSDEGKLKAIFSAPLGDGLFRVAYRQGGALFPGMSDEERRVNINTAPQNILESLLSYFGEDPAIAAYIAQWRSPGPGLDDGYYEALPSPYKCKHEKFSAAEELLLVKGINRKIFDKIKDHVTVFGDPARFAVNINTAPREVLGAVLMSGASINKPIDKAAADIFAGRITAFRDGPDGTPGTVDDNGFTADIKIEALLPEISTQAAELKNYFTTKSTYFRIESTGVVSGSKTAKRLVAVVQQDRGKVSQLKSYREY